MMLYVSNYFTVAFNRKNGQNDAERDLLAIAKFQVDSHFICEWALKVELKDWSSASTEEEQET